jgi:hypothetical protein
MNATAALGMALLKGDVVTIKTAFNLFGITNAPREISRAIEQPFDLEVSRVKREGKSRWGVYCTWTEYRLNKSERNIPGIKKLTEYVKKNMSSRALPVTDSEKKVYKQTDLWLQSL